MVSVSTTAVENAQEYGHGYQVLLNTFCGKYLLQRSDGHPLIYDGNTRALRENFEQIVLLFQTLDVMLSLREFGLRTVLLQPAQFRYRHLFYCSLNPVNVQDQGGLASTLRAHLRRC